MKKDKNTVGKSKNLGGEKYEDNKYKRNSTRNKGCN